MLIFVNICLSFAGDFVRVPDWTAVVVVVVVFLLRPFPTYQRRQKMKTLLLFLFDAFEAQNVANAIRSYLRLFKRVLRSHQKNVLLTISIDMFFRCCEKL